MDSKGLGNDWCVAWPTAEIAVMGAPRRGADPLRPQARARSTTTTSAPRSRPRSSTSTRTRFANPYVAAERGYVDDVIAAIDTRRVLAVDARAVCAPSASDATAPPPLATHRSRLPETGTGTPMLLDGKRILVTGVLNDASIAFSVARLAQEQGAEVVLTSFGRVMSLTAARGARGCPTEPEIVELDVTNQDDLDALAGDVGGRLDGVRARDRRSRPSRASAAGSSTRRGRTSPSRCRCRRTR